MAKQKNLSADGDILKKMPISYQPLIIFIHNIYMRFRKNMQINIEMCFKSDHHPQKQWRMHLFNLSLWRRPSQNWAPSNRETGTRGERVKIASQHDHTRSLHPTQLAPLSLPLGRIHTHRRLPIMPENWVLHDGVKSVCVVAIHLKKHEIILMWHNHMIQQTETGIRTHTWPSN